MLVPPYKKILEIVKKLFLPFSTDLEVGALAEEVPGVYELVVPDSYLWLESEDEGFTGTDVVFGTSLEHVVEEKAEYLVLCCLHKQ